MVILVFLVVILVFYFTYSIVNQYSEVKYVESDVDNREYIIRNGSKSERYLKDSANTLAEINKRVSQLIEYLDAKYKDDPSANYIIKILKRNYSPSILSEAAIDKRYTTYTVDKQDMHICLRTRDQAEKMYDIDLLMYVVLHELAHMCNYDRNENPIQGHGQEFKQIFKMLVIEAIKIGVYKYTDYTIDPKSYCGIVINSSILPSGYIGYPRN